MNLKITVISSEKEKKAITVNDIEPGTVFTFNDDDSVVSLKLQNGKVVHLKFWDEGFRLSDDTMHHKNIEILGHLNEIIVVKE